VQLAVSADEHCKVPCRIPALTGVQAEAFRQHIQHGFNITMCAGSAVLSCLLCW